MSSKNHMHSVNKRRKLSDDDVAVTKMKDNEGKGDFEIPCSRPMLNDPEKKSGIVPN